MHVTAIIAAAGSGTRAGSVKPKQLVDIGGGTMLQHSLTAFHSHPRIDEIILVLPKDTSTAFPLGNVEGRRSPDVRRVTGGERRQDSVANAFDLVNQATDIVLIHDAARPFVTADLIDRTIDAAAEHGAAIAAVQSRDTVKQVDAAGVITGTIPRERTYLAQTPQGFRREVLAQAMAAARSGVEATDEAALVERAGYRVHVVAGDAGNVKVTTAEDLEAARMRIAQQPGRAAVTVSRVGTGYDLHRLVDGRPLVIGGVTLPFDKGPLGHSDGDVACHAATDAILGAASLGDIGRHFPDTDAKWKGADSLRLLAEAARMAREAGYRIENLDITVILERPKIKDAIDAMRSNIAQAIDRDVDRVSIKGKTNEGVDAIGRGEAIAAHAVALLVHRSSVVGHRPSDGGR